MVKIFWPTAGLTINHRVKLQINLTVTVKWLAQLQLPKEFRE